MAETTVLRSSASTRQTGNTSAAPAVQLSGAHPMVNVHMGSGGVPQLAGAAHPNVALGRPTGQRIANQGVHPSTGVALSGPLPMIQVNMNNGRPQQGSAPQARSVVLLPPKNMRLPNGGTRQVVAPVAPPSRLSSDQLLLCRHLVSEHLKSETPLSVEDSGLAESTLAAIEQALIDATTAQAIAAPPPRMVVAAGPRAAQIAGLAAPRRVRAVQVQAPPAIRNYGEPRVVPDIIDAETVDVAVDDGEVDVDAPENEV